MAGRPRSFDRDAVLELAMHQFWERGFDGVGIAELCAQAGISPPSLYGAFGDKQALFDEAVALYTKGLDEGLHRDLSAPTVAEAVEQLLTSSAAHFTGPGHPPGCLVMGEPRLAHRRRVTERAIRDRLRRGVKDGELASRAEADELAGFLDTVLAGMAARARDGASRAELSRAVRAAVRALPPAR